MISGQEFIKRFEAYCPLWLAEEGDPVGLHVGTLNKPRWNRKGFNSNPFGSNARYSVRNVVPSGQWMGHAVD